MTQSNATALALGQATIEELRASLRGSLLSPSDAEYDAHRHVWNGAIDKHPALIARCSGVADVLSALQFARSQHLPVAVRGGAHNVAGNATCDDGIVIDLSPMKGISVDPVGRTVRAQAGATWGDLDHETQAFGLATTGGLVSTTGIAGFTLGGGVGWLMRKYGMACDNLLSVELITADGQRMVASAQEHSELFWGVRGGGGNFGIVTTFEYALHPVSTVLAGFVVYPVAQAGEVLRFYREFCSSAPDELTLLAVFFTGPTEPFIPAHLQGQPIFAIAGCYCGSVEAGAEALRPLRAFGPPAADLFGPMPYTVVQTLFDADVPKGIYNYWRSDYLRELSDDAIDAITARAAAMTSPRSELHVHQMGGAVGRVSADATAFGHRDAPYLLNALSIWENPSDDAQHHIEWVRGTSTAVRPFAQGIYVNFLGNEGGESVRAAYDTAAFERLVSLKSQYDPTNLFQLNQNIPPRP